MVVSSPQCGENTAFFFGFPLGGNHGQGIFPVIPLELQGKKHQPFSMTQPIWGAVLKFPADTAIRARSFAPVSAEHSLP